MTQSLRPAESISDPAQLVRIEAVHRGYLFQHLCAAQCLLSAATLSPQTVFIETDEDFEIQLDGICIYVQVKYRKTALSWSYIESAMARFDELRHSHNCKERQGAAQFVVISNSASNGPLSGTCSHILGANLVH